MTDYSELKRLAEACSGVSGSELIGAKVRFNHAAKPSAVLALIAEVESLRSQVTILQSDANSWQSGYGEGRRLGAKTALDEREELRKDKDRLDALEANFWDVRHISTQVGQEGDTSESIEIVGSWMDAPRERVIGENYNENLRAAIDQAMTADAYPPERPEYEDEEGDHP